MGMARTPRHFDTLRPSRRRLILAALAVVGLIVLSLVSGNRGGSADNSNDAAAQSVGYFNGAPTASSTTTVAGQPSTNPGDPKAATTAPPTTAAPPRECGSEFRPAFGCPLYTDNFDGDLNKGAQGWIVYDYPNAAFPRVASNFEVTNGEMQLHGSYNSSNGEILGSGVSSKVSQKYGRWEVRMRVEKGRGWSAASLLWPTDENWPTDGEVDLFEIPKGDRQSIFETIHNGVRDHTGENVIQMDATQWHTYAVEWTPTRLVYYVDNKAQWTVTKSLLVPSTGDLNMTLQMDPGTSRQCGGWFECPNNTTPAQTTMHVDYVKIWKYQPDEK